ncbi:hypothetical protein KM043_003657 [Ampulex compressa]|nr:hypothetical protein KM043_003657 [Ampulex compressa]
MRYRRVEPTVTRLPFCVSLHRLSCAVDEWRNLVTGFHVDWSVFSMVRHEICNKLILLYKGKGYLDQAPAFETLALNILYAFFSKNVFERNSMNYKYVGIEEVTLTVPGIIIEGDGSTIELPLQPAGKDYRLSVNLDVAKPKHSPETKTREPRLDASCPRQSGAEVCTQPVSPPSQLRFATFQHAASARLYRLAA